MSGWVYIVTNKRGGALYVGVTNDLVRRVYEHREVAVPGFTRTHATKRLVWFEEHATMPLAIQCEKTLKRWLRAWKLTLIEKMNPEWADLWGRISS